MASQEARKAAIKRASVVVRAANKPGGSPWMRRASVESKVKARNPSPTPAPTAQVAATRQFDERERAIRRLTAEFEAIFGRRLGPNARAALETAIVLALNDVEAS